MKKLLKYFSTASTVPLVIIMSLLAFSANLNATVNKFIHVNFNVVAAACSINAGNVISVNFGDSISTAGIDGKYNTVPIDYKVACDSPYGAVKMKLDGQPTQFDANAIQTNMTDLGVRVLQDGQTFPVGTWVSVDYSAMPTLEAVLVKTSGAKLPGGEFSASATLSVYYE
ncbi:fimbrial protein [Pantoea sp. 1.19]|uniref:fimbrial protein n=1 Tax=Pantoea sp. 1.19 TaxID=1925589 RepID=UPI0009FB5E19|nr:fimbrial protein [Pantoea sp. 1.19]